jgi:uncharacterized protein YdcH (DUF465 family)
MDWYLKKASGEVFGPVTPAALRQWAAGGRIAPDDELSNDQETWLPAVDQPDLGLDWMVELAPDKLYGPFHLLALGDLIREGSVPATSPIIHRTTGERHVLHDALMLVVLEQNTRLAATAQELRQQLETAQAEIESLKAMPVLEPPPTAPAPEAPAPAEPPSTSTTPPAPVAPEPAAAAPEPTPAPEPPPPQKNAEWKEMAAKRDHFEKETHRWKRLYSDLQSSAQKREGELNERIEHLRREELAARTQLEQTQISLTKLQRTVKQISDATVFPTAGESATAQRTALLDAYNELSRRCDALVDQINAKSAELEELMQNQLRIKDEADQRVQTVEANLRKEREEADRARKRALMLEEDHLQLLRSFRDLNDRYIRLRQGSGHVSTAEHPWPPPSELAPKKAPPEL